MSERWGQDEWRPVAEAEPEVEQQNWLGRLISPRDGREPGDLRRHSRLALILSGLGAVAFVLSLVLGWQIVTLRETAATTPNNQVIQQEQQEQQQEVITSGIGSIDTLGLVYLLGVVALLALAAALVGQPDRAARHRFAIGGGVIGLLGILIAVTVRLPQNVWPLERAYGVFFSGDQMFDLNRFDIAYGPGLFAAYFAVALPAAGIWVASRGVAGPAAVVPAPAPPAYGPYAADPETEPSTNGGPPPVDPPPYRPPAQSGPRDLTVTPG